MKIIIKRIMNLVFILGFIAIYFGILVGFGSFLVYILTAMFFKVNYYIFNRIAAYGICTTLVALFPYLISSFWSHELIENGLDKIEKNDNLPFLPSLFAGMLLGIVAPSVYELDKVDGSSSSGPSKPRDIEIKEADSPFSLIKVPTGKIKFNADGSVKEVITYKK